MQKCDKFIKCQKSRVINFMLNTIYVSLRVETEMILYEIAPILKVAHTRLSSVGFGS